MTYNQLIFTHNRNIISYLTQVGFILQIVDNENARMIEFRCNDFDNKTVAFRMHYLDLDVCWVNGIKDVLNEIVCQRNCVYRCASTILTNSANRLFEQIKTEKPTLCTLLTPRFQRLSNN